MPSTWVRRRPTKDGGSRYRVEYRIGGRESASRYAGSFATKREALARKAWVAGELANMRLPDVTLAGTVQSVVTVRTLAERWKASRVDVAAGTMQTYEVALGRILPRLGTTAAEKLDAQTVADMVAELHAAGLKK